ncbi:NPCBM/NEW2 domain-containing protein [Bacteroides sp.]|uniref:NPCBM/NEW2 domain-containing protein n=1 Tax=Bacteroides sp. TaxID=29523 RepID=UPI003FA53A60
MKKAIFALLFSCGAIAAQADGLIKLSEMDLGKAYQQYGGLKTGTSVTGEAPSIGGVKQNNVIGVHSKSLIKIDLKGDATDFSTGIGVADSHMDCQAANIMTIPLADGKRVFYSITDQKKNFVGVEGDLNKVSMGSVTFRILGDGKELLNQPMKAGEAMKNIHLKLNGIQILELVVEDGGDGPSGDFALWVDPTFTYFEIPPTTVEADYVGIPPQMDTLRWNFLKNKIARLPNITLPLKRVDFDWLITPNSHSATVYRTSDEKTIVLSNGLIARTFRITPNLATTDMINLMTGENMLRAVSSEGSLCLDGKSYSLGGLQGQPERGYIKSEWIEHMAPIPHSFLIEDFEITPLKESISWARSRWALNKAKPTGQTLTFTLRGQNALSKTVVKLHYDLYDAIPTLRKRMEVINESDIPFTIDSFKLELLAFAEPESPVGGDPQLFIKPNICIESNYAFGGFNDRESEQTEKWITDPEYTSQCNYAMQTPCILEVSPKIGPDVLVTKTEPFTSFDVYEMPYDSDDRERKGLFKRRMYSTVAPWITENPIFMHLTSIDPQVVKTAIDQCAEVGYEMLILSFGSGVNMESTNPEHLKAIKRLVDYANHKGIELGGYSLLSSRWISDEVDVINPKTGKRGGMIFGSSPCLCSEWGKNYFEQIKTFAQQTGFRVFEHDGSYPGNLCASTTHKYHNGLQDSQWKQWKKITDLYRWMCENGIYINVPDYYFLSGSTKTGIGYREVNWSLPRDRQLIHGRQVNYAGTFDRPASACWTFVPLVEYHGGGEAATLEPLSKHLDSYKLHMIQNYGAGIQACYRGPRLYDTDATKQTVKEVIDWYKKYRTILNSDLIHLRKADGRDWDGFMHVNPSGDEKGFALFFNPTDEEMKRTIHLPLYYTGLTDKAAISCEESKAKTYKLKRDYSVELPVTIPANGYVWYVIR